jgi:hypothetical protein
MALEANILPPLLTCFAVPEMFSEDEKPKIIEIAHLAIKVISKFTSGCKKCL